MKRIYLRALVSFAFCQFGLAAGNDSLPPPVSDKIYTFQQIEQQKLDLNDKIVRIEIGSLLGDGKSHLPNKEVTLPRDRQGRERWIFRKRCETQRRGKCERNTGVLHSLCSSVMYNGAEL